MTNYRTEIIMHDDGLDDGIVIVNHDHGHVTINSHAKHAVGVCRGKDGFLEQMRVLSLLQHNMRYEL